MVGSLGDWTGIAEGSTLPGQKAILAWFQAINARGGIGGHKVQLIAEDTGGDPARAQAVAKDLVETRHAVAIVDAAQPFTFDNTRPYFEAQNIPVIGTDLTLMSEWASPVVFPQGSTSETLNSGVVKTAAEQGKKKIGIIYCAESAACQANVGQINDAAAKYGGTVVYSGQASLGAPDFTAECIQAQQRGADAMIVYLDVNGYSRVMTSCGRQNYHPLWMAQAGSTGDILGQNPNSDGLIVASPVFPWVLDSPQEFADFQAAMKKYASGTALTASMSQAWAAGELFRAAAEKAIAAGGGHLTRDGLFDALWAMQGETVFGTAPALAFNKGHPAAQPTCYFPLVLHNGKMTAPQDAKAACL